MLAHPPRPGLPRQAPSVINCTLFISTIIRIVAGGSKPENPLLEIPVSAEQAAWRQRRVRLGVAFAAVIALTAAGWTYKRWVDPIHARESYQAGMHFLALARYDQAIIAFGRAAALQPGMTDAYLMRAHAYNALSKPEEALADLT